MWTAEHRRAADRKGLRYPSDMRDAEWALIASLIRPAKRGGRKRSVSVREVLNGFFSTTARAPRPLILNVWPAASASSFRELI
jgi:transposase